MGRQVDNGFITVPKRLEKTLTLHMSHDVCSIPNVTLRDLGIHLQEILKLIISLLPICNFMYLTCLTCINHN